MHPAAAALLAGGPFTTAQARAVGLTRPQLRTLLRRCVTLRRGVHVDADLAARAADDPRTRLVLAGRAAALALDGAVLSHRTAAVFHGFPLLGRLPDRPELTREPRSRDDSSSVAGLRVARLPPGHRTTQGGAPVTTLARTAVDLARTQPWRAAVVAADAALAAGCPAQELDAVASWCSPWPGGPDAQRVAAFADGRAETPLESITRVAYAEQGLPPPATQVEVWRDGRFVALVDFLWESQRVVGEADGLGKYDRPGALRDEKLREEALRACGLEVVRNLWDDVWSSAAQRRTGERVRAGFSYALTRPVVPGVRFVVPPLTELQRRRRR